MLRVQTMVTDEATQAECIKLNWGACQVPLRRPASVLVVLQYGLVMYICKCGHVCVWLNEPKHQPQLGKEIVGHEVALLLYVQDACLKRKGLWGFLLLLTSFLASEPLSDHLLHISSGFVRDQLSTKEQPNL